MKSRAAALTYARTLAWALWLGGWLVIGGFGRQHLPPLAGWRRWRCGC